MSRRAAVLVPLMALAVFSACNRNTPSGGPPATHPTGPPQDDNGGGELTAAGDLDLKDCVNFPDEVETTTEVSLVDCEQKHDGQVVSTIEFGEEYQGEFKGEPDAEYPGEDLIIEAADEDCLDSGEFYSEENPDLELNELMIFPDEKAWDDGDRKVACVMVLESGERELEGTLEGL